MKTQITKLRNTEGKICTCANCGREITNLFQVGTKIYGSECVISLFGAFGENQVKSQNLLAKKYNGISEATKSRSMNILNITEDQYFTRFITTGQF